MKKAVLLTFLLFIFRICSINAQASAFPGKAGYLNSVNNFEQYIIKHYHPDKRQIKWLCENSCIFIRFKILKGGKIDSLAFSVHTVGFSDSVKNTPAFITAALKRAFKGAENSKVLTKELQAADRTYLLPFIYFYNSGCYAFCKEQNDKQSIPGSDLKDPGEQQEAIAILNILNFPDKKYNNKHYTILNPIKVGNDDGKFFF